MSSSIEFIERYEGTKSIYVRKNESKVDRLKKLTHLHLNGKRIEKIGDLSGCNHLKVLYLHNNVVQKIENLTKLTHLTHLYLQWNQIDQIENLASLKSLRILFLGNNRISRLENLEKLTHLEELHIERQRLNHGTEFSFDLGCLDVLSKKLRVFNVTGLGLINLDFLPTLQCLHELIAAENKFECPTEIGESIRSLPVLRKVEFRGCPAQKDIHYKEKIMAKAPRIMVLDGKELSGNTRSFIQKMQDRGGRKTETNSVEVTPTKKVFPNDLSLSSFSFDPSYCTQIESIAYQSWNSLHPKYLSKKHARQSNFLLPKQDSLDLEIETRSVDVLPILPGRLLPAARPRK